MGKGRDRRRKAKARKLPATTRVVAGDTFTTKQAVAAAKFLEANNQHPDADGDYVIDRFGVIR